MPTFLSDPTLGVYLALLLVAIVGVGVWFRNRTRPTAVFAAVTVGLLLALFGIDRAFESPREESGRRVREMATAANARDWVTVGTHVAEKFEYAGRNKAKFLADIAPAALRFEATANFKDFDRDNFEALPDGRVRLGFVGQFSTPAHGMLALYVEAVFVKEADGAYRLQGFKVYDYITRTKGGEQALPGLPGR